MSRYLSTRPFNPASSSFTLNPGSTLTFDNTNGFFDIGPIGHVFALDPAFLLGRHRVQAAAEPAVAQDPGVG